MQKQAPIVILALLLLTFTAYAQDFNAMAEAEIQAYINQQVIDAIAAQPQQPQIVTMQMDEQSKQTIEKLNNQINELKSTIEQLNLRFAQMSEHLDAQFESYSNIQKTFLTSELTAKLPIETKSTQDYVKEMTNPVRMNLPAIAVFGMLTSVFLLWVSKYYRPKGAGE